MKATLTLSNGTVVTIEGPTEDVGELLDRFDGMKRRDPAKLSSTSEREPDTDLGADVTEIVNLVKDCDQAAAIERNILAQRSMLERVLLPLYVSAKHQSHSVALTSGEISKITFELGVPVSQSNTSSTLSGSASRYVMGDRQRVRGQAVRYRLSRRGVEFMDALLDGRQTA